jgi:hypothetical protein
MLRRVQRAHASGARRSRPPGQGRGRPAGPEQPQSSLPLSSLAEDHARELGRGEVGAQVLLSAGAARTVGPRCIPPSPVHGNASVHRFPSVRIRAAAVSEGTSGRRLDNLKSLKNQRLSAKSVMANDLRDRVYPRATTPGTLPSKSSRDREMECGQRLTAVQDLERRELAENKGFVRIFTCRPDPSKRRSWVSSVKTLSGISPARPSKEKP